MHLAFKLEVNRSLCIPHILRTPKREHIPCPSIVRAWVTKIGFILYNVFALERESVLVELNPIMSLYSAAEKCAVCFRGLLHNLSEQYNNAWLFLNFSLTVAKDGQVANTYFNCTVWSFL